MFWKERYSRLGGGLRWLGSRPVALFFSVLLGCYLFDVMYPVVGALLHMTWRESDRYVMNSAFRTSSSVLSVLAMLPIMAAAATSLTSEREQDTWTSLATTLLTPREVVRAKELGAIWSARWIGIALLALWGSGLVFFAIHPVGLLAAIGILASSAWLISAFGVFASTVAVNSIRALFITFGVIFALMAALWLAGELVVVTGVVSRHVVSLVGAAPELGCPLNDLSAAAIGCACDDRVSKHAGALVQRLGDFPAQGDLGQGVSRPQKMSNGGGYFTRPAMLSSAPGVSARAMNDGPEYLLCSVRALAAEKPNRE